MTDTTFQAPAPRPQAYEGPMAFCFVTGEPDFRGFVYGPQAQQFTPIGEMPDGRKIGVCGLYPETLSIIRGAHPDEFICSTWNELLTRTDLTPHLAWMVQLEDGSWKLERDLDADDAVRRTPAGHKTRRPPVDAGLAAFDPDHVPAVGTRRVIPVDGGVDREQVVLSDAQGRRHWHWSLTGEPARR